MKKETRGTAYARAVVKGEVVAGKYVIMQCKDFLKIAEGKDEKYFLKKERTDLIENLSKVLIMPKGLKRGESFYTSMIGYQWLVLEAGLCVFYREDTARRRYETIVLELARKNFKTFTVATIIIFAFFLEPNFSKFFSVAPVGMLSKEVQEALIETIESSPLIYSFKGKMRFKILKDSITYKKKKSKYIPLNFALHTMDGKLPNVFVADEVGALPSNYPIEAMRSGQLNVKNKLGLIISTKYPTILNPFEDEVAYSKKVLDGLVKDETVFSMLYEPDEPERWMTDDLVLKQANPAALVIKEIWEDLLKKRARAIEVPSTRENFLTKHCNIVYQGAELESYVDISELKNCAVSKIDWSGRDVWVGLDLAMTNDNCAVAIVSEEDGRILAESIAFIPEGRIEEKNRAEKIDYNKYIRLKQCVACGNKIVDYKVIEDFIFDIEKNLNVNVQAVGYDRYNALSTAQKLEERYTTIEVKQHSSVLHSPTKLLSEKIQTEEFEYQENELLEINFSNAKCVYDTNMNRYVNKKRSRGKIDMVMAILNALCLLEKDVILNQADDYVYQVF